MNALETKVLEIIGENVDSPDVFVDTDAGLEPIRDSLSDAIQEIAMLTGSKKSKYFLTLREGQAFYRLRLDYGSLGWITDVWSFNQRYRLDQTSVARLSATDPRWMVTNAEPRSYFTVGSDVVGVWPKPGASSNMIELEVVEIPAPYTTSADRLALRSEFEHAAAQFAVGEFWASRGDAREAESHFAHYLRGLGIAETFGDRDRTRFFSTMKEPHPRESL